ncbi:glycoside hydrolase family 1 protein [Streptococcus penaeicida]|uniref:glycoside hydrolase family 1 protein n=1 Tax=Streptococcus penaeicida TaxID=1765960 RepID=UPI0039EE7AEA
MKIKIPENFILGAATSAWQTEGWIGKKPGQDSFLDKWFQEEPFVWHQGQGPKEATNFMEMYQDDLDLMSQIGISHYRTSINWSRFFVDYENLIVDEDYASHIDALIDGLLAIGVQPIICLEHYEVPYQLMEKYDAWSSKKVVDLFAQYAQIVFQRYGDRVQQWVTFNEPIVSQTRCYLDAIRWPHERNSKKWMLWNYHKVLATAKVVKIFHEGGYSGRIGCIINPEMVYPRSSSPEDLDAARRYDLFYNRVFLDPMIKGSYPEELIELCKENDIYFDPTEEELALISTNRLDFVGLNQYYPKRVKSQRFAWREGEPFHPEKYYEDFQLPGRQMNQSRGWEIYPQIMYDLSLYMNRNYPDIPWFIAENGMGQENEENFKDQSGMIDDQYRIDYISQHLYHLLRGVEEGSKCEGYMLWAFTDCVSPMNAFKNRYGLVSIDLENDKKRSLKKSAYWFKSVIENQSFELENKM